MKLTELRQKTAKDLQTMLAAKRQELVDYAIALSTQTTKQSHQRQILRHDVAQILTVLKEQVIAGGDK